MIANLYKGVLVPWALCFTYFANAQTPDCADTTAALEFWRPVVIEAEKADANTLAAALLQCLNSPNSELRDEIAYGLFSNWLRNERLSTERQQFMLHQLSANLSNGETELSLQRSFSALIISELLRADAINAFMTEPQREQLLQTSVTALREERDYRGWEEALGWVHPIAHMSDVMWRFALHPALTEDQAEKILSVVRRKATTTESFYHFNEGDRLARPLVILLRREALPSSAWVNWLTSFELPHSVNSWPEVFGSTAGLTELHNTKLFIRALSDQLQEIELDSEVQQKLNELVALFTGLV